MTKMTKVTKVSSATLERGFTLMEIIVATTIFVVVVTAVFSLFNYTLRINRRSEALRQATQGMRSLVEYLVKEIRNGQIDYSVVNWNVVAPLAPCFSNPSVAVGNANVNGSGNVGDIYNQTNGSGADNRFGLITAEGDRECIYLNNNSADLSTVASGFTGKNLVMNKNGVVESLNPQYFTVDQAKFYIRPLKHPYTTSNIEKTQPIVVMMFVFKVQLPTGEKVPIYYETAVSSGSYDIPTGS